MRFYDYPNAEEIAKFFRQTGERLEELNRRVNILLEQTYAQGQLDSIHFTETLARVAALESALKEADTRITVIHEPFVDTKGLDDKALKLPAAQVASEYGILTLRRSGGDTVQPRYARIVGGNGWPGNTHQVYEETGLYYARDGLHNDLSALLDGNADTWLEYERILALPGTKYAATAFAEGMGWLEFEWLPLELEIELEMEELQPLGALVVFPFLPPLPGYRPAKMMTVIDDGRGLRQYFGWMTMSDNIFIPCLPQPARKIKVVCRQETGIKVAIGLPDRPLPLAVAGAGYDPSGQVMLPIYDTDSTGDSREDILINTYYSRPAAQSAPAVRYMIGLKEIRPAAYTYVEESEFVSHSIPISPNARAVRLDGSYIVPEFLRQEKLVKWSLSFDDGTTWLEVATTDADAKLYELPREVKFSGYVPVFLRSKYAVYLPNRPEDMRVKIELRRPVSMDLSEYLTPAVSEYTLVFEEEGVA